ncbi:MAG: helix-turn-helix domain-containing protein [Candidatus Marinimicrobia bacterium]|nr:helix-turn-helix domain-containing protein [Candidatus Neomarinimicrobiota bacterium]
MKIHKVTLTQEEIAQLKAITRKGRKRARVIKSALILLNVDEGPYGKRKKDKDIADILSVTVRTIENIRKRFVLEGFDIALYSKPRERIYDRKVDGDVEAHIIALSCSKPPKGYAKWSLRLLADKIVELRYIESISHERVRQVLKKTN